MKMKAAWWAWPFLLAGLYLNPTAGSPGCPPGCYCLKQRSELVPEGSGLKINCHPLSSGPLNFSLLPLNTIQLDLAKYGLKDLGADAFESAPYLQKLDLQNNEISRIESGAFRSLQHLELLDLSRNSLRSVSAGMFSGLKKLERLKLNDNRLQTLENGSLDDLTSLNKLELSDNSFVCNCSLIWFIDWISTRPTLLMNTARTKCALPIDLADVPLRKANKDDFRCGDFAKDNSLKPVGLFQLEPTEHQVAFEGDSLKLKCRVQVSASQKVSWLIKGKPVDASEAENVISGQTLLPGDIVEASVNIVRLKAAHSGDWTCIVGAIDETTNSKPSSALQKPVESSANFKPSSAFQKSVNILVVTAETRLCSPHVTHTSRGTFKWGVAIGGHTVQQSCPSSRQQQRFGFAYFLCKQSGEWSPSVNASQCAYTSETTETLHKFASMNTSFDTVTLLESAKHFLNFTGNPAIFTDPLDVVYFSRAVANYLPYLKRNTDVGHYMMDMIANTLRIDPDLMSRAQKRGLAAKQLIDVVENITNVATSFQHQDESLALEGRPLKPMHFDGLACTWYSSVPSGNDFQRFSSKRVFHCSQGNKTLPSQGKKIVANVVMPHNLYQQLSSHGLLIPANAVNLHLTFAAFANSSLFPASIEASEFRGVAGPVVGGLIVGLPVFNLSDPVYVVLWSPENLDNLDPGSVQPVWWNPSSNGGFGDWSPDFCQIINAKSNLVWFSCSRLGYYGYRISRGALDSRIGVSGSGFRLHHPVTYACAAICISVLLLSVMVYITCHASLRISRKLKHALPNVWTSMALLCFLYVAGIHQTQHQIICRSIGITIHYLTLTTLLWLVVCTHIVYQKVTKQRRQTIRRSLGQDPIRSKLKRPVTRFYLFGWGVGVIVVAITASINVDYYTTNRHCFLKLAPFLGAVVVPAAVLLSLLIGFSLSAYCVMSTAPSHVTEQIEIDVFLHHGRPGSGLRGSGSLLSVSTFHLPDEERSSKSLLHSQSLLLLLFVISWSMAALAVTNPSTVEQVFPLEDLFAIFFGLASASLGVFVFVYFCVLRRDVRRCWRQPICLSRTRHRAYEEEEDDRLLETSNIYPNPATTGTGSQKYNFAAAFPSNTISDNLPPPHGYNYDAGHQQQLQFSGQESQLHGTMQRVTRGAVAHDARSKEVPSMTRKDSDEVSSDHLSVNNLNHLRRGYVAPVNSGCVSEADYTMLPFGQISKPNNFQQKMTSHQPQHTSSPAGCGLPQFIDLSPLAAPESHLLQTDTQGPYNVVSVPSNARNIDSRLENGYTESSTIKVGHPCQLASLTTADFPSHIVGTQTSLAGRQVPMPRFGRALNVGSHKSASMPRRQHYSRQRSRKDAADASSDHDREETRSKHSVGSSTCYSSKSNGRHKRHKRPNRKRPRAKDEPVYNNVSKRRDDDNDCESVEDNYLGDDDHFDTLERRRSSVPASSTDQIFDPLLGSEDDAKDQISSSQLLIHDFTAADLLKRETSV